MASPVTFYRKELTYISGRKSFSYLARAREYAKRGYRVINFGIGQPDVPTPKPIADEAKKAIDSGFTGYTESTGIVELREAIAEYLNSRYSADVKFSEVLITPGGLAGIYLAMVSYLEPGDEVVIIEPSYPPYTEIAKFVNAVPKYVPLIWRGPDRGFEINMEMLEDAVSSRTKMIILNNPHNPTGSVFPPKVIERVYEIARSRNIVILSDEVYDNFILDGMEFKSTLSFSEWRDYLIYVNSFSKTFSMTGWRLGYIVAREDVISRLSNLAVNIWSCPTSFVQKAGVTALKNRGTWNYVKEMIDMFKKRRDHMVSKLRELKYVEVYPSKATFYLFPNVEKLLSILEMDEEQFAEKLLEHKQVVVLPGTGFPEKAGKGFIRMSFSLDIEKISEGIERIKMFINEALSNKNISA